MYLQKLFGLILSCFLFSTATTVKAADANCGLFSQLSNDVWNIILPQLDWQSRAMLAKSSKDMKAFLVVRFMPTAKDATLTAQNFQATVNDFRFAQAVFGVPFELQSCTVATQTSDDYGKIASSFLPPCPFTAKTLKFQLMQFGYFYIDMVDLRDQQSLENFELKAPQFLSMSPSFYASLAKAKKLSSISIKGPEVNTACLQSIAENTSLTSLSIDKLKCDSEDIALPQGLKSVYVEGLNLTPSLFESLCKLEKPTSVEIRASWDSDERTIDISKPLLLVLTDKLEKLNVFGPFFVDEMAIEAIVKSKLPYLTMTHRFGGENTTFDLKMGPSPSCIRTPFALVFSAFHHDNLRAVIRGMLKKKLNVNIKIGSDATIVTKGNPLFLKNALVEIEAPIASPLSTNLIDSLGDEEFRLSLESSHICDDIQISTLSRQ